MENKLTEIENKEEITIKIYGESYQSFTWQLQKSTYEEFLNFKDSINKLVASKVKQEIQDR